MKSYFFSQKREDFPALHAAGKEAMEVLSPCRNPPALTRGDLAPPGPAVVVCELGVCRGDTHTCWASAPSVRIAVCLDTEGSKGKQKDAIIYKTEAAGDEALLKKTFESGWIAYSSRE